jgi:mRNA-degrading endonuclease RelE of RelBE toxin-antitoxin system
LSKFIWTDRAKEQLRQIDRGQALDILHALTDYAASGKGQVKKLKGSGDLRLRVGDYRVRFEVAEEDTYRIHAGPPSERTIPVVRRGAHTPFRRDAPSWPCVVESFEGLRQDGNAAPPNAPRRALSRRNHRIPGGGCRSASAHCRPLLSSW